MISIINFQKVSERIKGFAKDINIAGTSYKILYRFGIPAPI